MSDYDDDIRESWWRGPSRVPILLSIPLTFVVAGLVALIAIGSGIEDTPMMASDAPNTASAPPPAPPASEMQLEQTPPPEMASPETAPPGMAEPETPGPAMAGSDSDVMQENPPAEAAVAPPDIARMPQEDIAAPAPAGAVAPGVAEAPASAPPSVAPPSVAGAAQPPNLAAAPPPPPTVAPPTPPAGGGLAPAPDPALVEQSPLGPLPRVAPDGRKSWQVYARPFDNRDSRPRIAIVMSGLGLSSAATEAAIQGLPGPVSLAFQPFADGLQQWIGLARAAGHEVLLNLPMEPVDFPANDPGPQALFVAFAPEENIERLEWALSRVSGYVGLLNHMGSRFTTSRDAMSPVMGVIRNRGLMFLDGRVSARSVATALASEMRVPRAINDRFLDAREVSRTTVDARLAELESIAEEVGVSVGIGQAFPVTIERIREWAAGLPAKGIVLAPISAVVDRQADR